MLVQLIDSFILYTKDKRLLSFLLILLCIGCQQNSTEQGIYQQREIRQIDTLVLEQDTAFLGFLTQAKQFGNYIGTLDIANATVLLFDKKGKFIRKLVVPAHIGEEAAPQSFCFTQSHIYILFSFLNKILCYDYEGKLLQEIPIEIPDKEQLQLEHRLTPLFEFDPQRKVFLIATAANEPYSPTFYQKSRVIGVFDEHGTFKTAFGSYPEEFHKGTFLSNGSFFAQYEDGKVYVLFCTSPLIQSYDLEGNLLDEFGQKSDNMDYTIHYDKGESAMRAGLITQTYYGFAKASDNTFYYFYLGKDSHKPNGLGTYFMRYQRNTKEYSKQVYGARFILNHAGENELSFLIEGTDNEEVIVTTLKLNE